MQQFQMSEGRIGPTSFLDISGPEAPSFRREKSSQCLHFDSGLGGRYAEDISLFCIDLGNSFRGFGRAIHIQEHRRLPRLSTYVG